MDTGYSKEVAQQILERFRAKGWNLYRKERFGEDGDERIRQGPAESLEMGASYVLLPVAADPRDPGQVYDALEALAVRLDRELPCIRIGSECLPMIGITPEEGRVKMHTPDGTRVQYPVFLESMDTFVDATSVSP